MNHEKHLSINKLPNYINKILLFFMFLGFLLVRRALDGDFYFLYSFGKHIVNDGFPIKDVLSLHSNMNILVQQWFTDIFFYFTYENFGTIGIILVVYIVLFTYIILFYKLCKLITNNFFLSVIFTTISSMIIAAGFMVTRPQIFTYIIFLLLIFFLEKYVRTQKKRYLCALPILSLIQINIHGSMWLMLFVLMLPYAVSCFNINLPFYKSKACCKLSDGIIIVIGMIVAAFINPYGYKALIYLFSSYGIDSFNQNISEMQAITITDPLGKLYLGILFLSIFLLFIYKERTLELRFLCLWLGTTVLGFTSYKATAYFFIIGFVALAHFFKNFEYTLKIKEGKRTQREKTRLIILILLLAISIGFLLFQAPSKETAHKFTPRITFVEPSINYLHTQDKDSMVLYAGFNEGSMLEFHGFKPYIDGRAELFLKANNGEFDYFDEYLDATEGRIYYKDFLDKYDFTHILVPTGSNHLYISISHDSDYITGFTDENYTVFIKQNK